MNPPRMSNPVQRSVRMADHSDAARELEGPRGTLAVDPLQARVDAAAFALLREGRNPTVSLVRARMGGASPNAVAPALQRWRLTFAAQLDENAGSALEVLPPGVLELVQALWSRALYEAHRVRADARSTVDALEQLDEAIKALHERTARLEKREAALDDERREFEHRRRRLQHPRHTRRTRPRLRKAAIPKGFRKKPPSAARSVPGKRVTASARKAPVKHATSQRGETARRTKAPRTRS